MVRTFTYDHGSRSEETKGPAAAAGTAARRIFLTEDESAWVDVDVLPPHLCEAAAKDFAPMFELHPESRGHVVVRGRDIASRHWHKSYGNTPAYQPALPASYMYCGATDTREAAVPAAFRPFLDHAHRADETKGDPLTNGDDETPAHSDCTRHMRDGAPIVMHSFQESGDGQPRLFSVTPNRDVCGDALYGVLHIVLRHGLVVATGGQMQRKFRHAVPATKGAATRRISLTLRKIGGDHTPPPPSPSPSPSVARRRRVGSDARVPGALSSVFGARVSDACVHAMMAFMDARSWFGLRVLSRYARSWCERPPQRAARSRRRAPRAAAHPRLRRRRRRRRTREADARDGLGLERRLARVRPRRRRGRGRERVRDAVRRQGVPGARASYGVENARPRPVRAVERHAGRHATVSGGGVLRAAVCGDARRTATGGRATVFSRFRDACRYLTPQEDVESARLCDPNGVYLVPPPPPHSAPLQQRAWAVRPVLESADDADADANAEIDAETKVARRCGAEKRQWRWAVLDTRRYRVPFVRARRLFRCPASGRSIDIVYVDLGSMNAALTATTRSRLCADARLETGAACPVRTRSYDVVDWYTLCAT